ncbi:MAG: diguanylate cyclase [Gammaproteobacteria bacterium]|nr:diguanylate cyclase [Gammaproteobacteria bacterium]
MNIARLVSALLAFILLFNSSSVLGKLSPEEEQKLEQMVQQNPGEALTYIDNKLSSTDKSTDEYLDYLGSKASILSITYNESELKKVLNEAIPLSEQHPDKRYLASFLMYQAGIEQTQGNYDQAISFSTKALQLAKNALTGERTDNLLLGNLLTNQGRTYYYEGKFEEAATSYRQAYKYFDQGGYDTLKISIINDLGNLASSTGDFEESIRNFEEVIQYYKEQNMELALGPAIFNLSLNYFYTNQLEKAKEYFTEAKRIGEKHNDILTQAHTSEWLGQTESKMNNDESALAHYKNALRLFNQAKNGPKVYTLELKLAELYLKNQQNDQAQQFVEQAKVLQEKIQSKTLQNELYRIESNLLESQGDFASALPLLKTYHQNFRQFVDETNQEQIHEMKSKFSSEREQAKNKLLEKELALKNAESKAAIQQKQKIQLALGLAIILILTLLYFFNKQQKLKKRLAYLAMTDELTGVKNRRAIFEKAKEQFEFAKRYGSQLTIGVCDLDHFKKLNDSYGHEIGDQVLKAFAKATNSSIRTVDYFGRIGGEEWLVVFPNTSADEISNVVKRINQKLKNSELPVVEIPTFSMGTTSLKEDDNKVADIISRADQALYKAKDAGRNRIINI